MCNQRGTILAPGRAGPQAVNHAIDFVPVDLVVVDCIEVHRDYVTGELTDLSGGRRRIWTDWIPASSALRATKYAYELPCWGRIISMDGRSRSSTSFATLGEGQWAGGTRSTSWLSTLHGRSALGRSGPA
jgi:hypothetical protein